MNRKLIAAFACRVGGKRLYGKPLQNIFEETSILSHMIDVVEQLPEIETVVLGISEGIENLPFVDLAKKRNIPYIFGDEIDVLHRLILCGRAENATDVYRVTTECPFTYFEPLSEAWERHVKNGNDVTATDGLPEGCNFEIYTLDALQASHDRGNEHHRSEGCSRYIREHRDVFQVEIITPPAECARPDLRLTVDYPEDLVICRRIFEHLKDKAPLIPLKEIISFLDDNPNLKELVSPYVYQGRIWPNE